VSFPATMKFVVWLCLLAHTSAFWIMIKSFGKNQNCANAALAMVQANLITTACVSDTTNCTDGSPYDTHTLCYDTIDAMRVDLPVPDNNTWTYTTFSTTVCGPDDATSMQIQINSQQCIQALPYTSTSFASLNYQCSGMASSKCFGAIAPSSSVERGPTAFVLLVITFFCVAAF